MILLGRSHGIPSDWELLDHVHQGDQVTAGRAPHTVGAARRDYRRWILKSNSTRELPVSQFLLRLNDIYPLDHIIFTLRL